MSKTHICPQEILDLFANPATVENGRERASRWAWSLKLQPNDLVWMPEMGWLIRHNELGDAVVPTFH